MTIYDYQAAFEAADKTSAAMRSAVQTWKQLYYGTGSQGDPCQRLAYTIVTKLCKAAFGEYAASAQDGATQAVLTALDKIRQRAFATALVEGECYLKPYPGAEGFSFEVVPGSNVLIFSQDGSGKPRDVGLVETSIRNADYYTLLERRTLDEKGYLTISYRLYKSRDSQKLGQQVKLSENPLYAELPASFTYPEPVSSVGLVPVKMPVVNCVDGSNRGVAVFAAAADLIANIDENEQQLRGEFQRGESRIIASRDMLSGGTLQDHLFVGLDDDPENVGITVFSPPLRVEAYLARKQEYLRNVESIVGLRRGMLSDANVEDRTATEIASSTADFNLTVLELQGMWHKSVSDAVELCRILSKFYELPQPQGDFSLDWGNGVLYDEGSRWLEYLDMVKAGILKPEIALGWRFGLPAQTSAQQESIRKIYMP